jgi:peroxin-6
LLVVVGVCEGDVPLAVRHVFEAEVQVGPPRDAERQQLLRFFLHKMRCTRQVEYNLQDVVRATAGVSCTDLLQILNGAVRRAVAFHTKQDPQVLSQEATDTLNARLLKAGVMLSTSDLEMEAQEYCKRHGLQADAGRIAHVDWEDIGGLDKAKQEILDVVELPLKQPRLFSCGLKKRSGVLLYGPPGCGKTLLAKAVASQCGLRFLSVKGPELLNMYVGESERNVRAVFAKAHVLAPCVVFFDELDSVAPHRGVSGDSGGVMDRVVSQLLAEVCGRQVDADLW